MPEPPVFKEPWIQRFSALFGEKKQTKEKKKVVIDMYYPINVLGAINTLHQTQMMSVKL